MWYFVEWRIRRPTFLSFMIWFNKDNHVIFCRMNNSKSNISEFYGLIRIITWHFVEWRIRRPTFLSFIIWFNKDNHVIFCRMNNSKTNISEFYYIYIWFNKDNHVIFCRMNNSKTNISELNISGFTKKDRGVIVEVPWWWLYPLIQTNDRYLPSKTEATWWFG
jgi:hypothetical protein